MFAEQELPTDCYTILHLPTTATDEELQQAYSTLSDPQRRAQYDLHSQYTYFQSKHAQNSQRARRDSDTFDPEYEFTKHQAPNRFRPHSPPSRPSPSPAEIYLRERREQEHRRQLRKDQKKWERFARKFAKDEREKVSKRVEKEGPIPEWLENVVEVDGHIDGTEPVVMEGEMLIDFEEDLIKMDKIQAAEVPRPMFPEETSSKAATVEFSGFEETYPFPDKFFEMESGSGLFPGLNPEAALFESEEWREDEFGRPDELLRRRGSLGSRGRKAAEEARRAKEEKRNEATTSGWGVGKSEWDIFFDRFETG